MTTAAIIITCDRPAMLRRAVASVRAQRFPVDEVIVVNDGVAEVHAPGVQLVRTGPHAGPSAARNAGAAVARSEVLAFLDDDDEWAPDHIEAIHSLTVDAQIVLTAFQREKRSGGTETKIPPASLRADDWFVKNEGLQGSNLAVRRDAFMMLNGFDELLWCAEDMDFAIRSADLGLRYVRAEQPTVTYHAHSAPRITSPNLRHRHAHRTFLAAHGSRMTADEVHAFRERVERLFGVDPGPVPKLVWVMGPPGAGKTTWATRCAKPTWATRCDRKPDRVLDFTDVMHWLDGADLGVRTAKRHMADAFRAVEGRRDDNASRLFVTPAYFDPEDLGQIQSFEHVVAIVPPPDRWRAQIEGRDGRVDEKHAQEHARWFKRFGTGARAAPAGLCATSPTSDS